LDWPGSPAAEADGRDEGRFVPGHANPRHREGQGAAVVVPLKEWWTVVGPEPAATGGLTGIVAAAGASHCSRRGRPPRPAPPRARDAARPSPGPNRNNHMDLTTCRKTRRRESLGGNLHGSFALSASAAIPAAPRCASTLPIDSFMCDNSRSLDVLTQPVFHAARGCDIIVIGGDTAGGSRPGPCGHAWARARRGFRSIRTA